MSTIQLSLFDTAEFTASEPKRTPVLADALACLDSIPFINSGGCGIAALAVYRWCKKNGIEVSDRPFVFLWRPFDEWEARNNDEHLNNGEIDLIEAPSHVGIELYDGLYDSEGLEGSDLFDYCTVRQVHNLNEDELLNVINRTEEWNPTFRRAKHIGKIEFALGIDLSDVVR